MHVEGKRKGTRMRWIVDRHMKPIHESVGGLNEETLAKDLVPQNTPRAYIHYILVGAISLSLHQAEECKRLTGIDPFDEESVEIHARTIERVFLR